MRIIYTLNDQKKGKKLSSFLASEGIQNQLEINTETDWGSANYGDLTCRLWIYDEDQVEDAVRWVKKFEENPDDPIFSSTTGAPSIIPFNLPSVSVRPSLEKKEVVAAPRSGVLTSALFIICTLLFIITESTSPPIPTSFPEYLPPIALFSAPIKKALYYDYPKKYELADQLVAMYGLGKLQNPQDLPPEGQYLLKKFNATPVWEGIYPLIVSWMRNQPDHAPQAPRFEKIGQGQVWRLFTPALLHHDILHLLFNMLWLLFLGRQIEERCGGGRYLLFILLTGVFSNTVQYLISGGNFIGISGVLCAMLTFIWVRQKVAPWEGYPLQKATINFMMVFILAMLGIQIFSFYLETAGQAAFTSGIANSAHLSGAALGALLGCLPFFSRKI